MTLGPPPGPWAPTHTPAQGPLGHLSHVKLGMGVQGLEWLRSATGSKAKERRKQEERRRGTKGKGGRQAGK